MVKTLVLYTCGLAVLAVAAGKGTGDLAEYLLSDEGKRFLVQSITSPRAWEAVVGEKVFVSGPHDEDMDYTATGSFGHYNPVFLNRVIDGLFTRKPSPAFIAAIRRLRAAVPARFPEFTSLAHARRFMVNYPAEYAAFKEAYRDLMAGGMRFSSYSGPLAAMLNNRRNIDAADLAFWVRRDLDGTIPVILKGARQFLRYTGSDALLAHAQYLWGEEHTVDNAVFFVTGSFEDHDAWGDPSALPCRQELITRHTWKNVHYTDAPETVHTVTDDALVQTRLNEAGCSELARGPYYALLPDGETARWVPVEPAFTLHYYISYVCEYRQQINLGIHVGSPTPPLLLRTGTPAAAETEIVTVRPGQEVHKEMKRMEFEFDPFPGVTALFATFGYSRFQGEPPAPPETVVSEMELWAEFTGGKQAVLQKRFGVGKYSYSPPAIGNIRILDANGDGHPDFMFDIDNGGRKLIFTRDGEVLRAVTLISTEYSGVGGC